MARSNEPIYWYPELTEEGKQLTDEFLAQLFAPIIRARLESEARKSDTYGEKNTAYHLDRR